jgi:hypothetical protein
MNDEIDGGVSWLLFLFVVVGGVDGDAEGLADGIEVGTHVRRSRMMGLIMGGGYVASRPSSGFGNRPSRRATNHATFDVRRSHKGRGRALASEWVNDARQSTPETRTSRWRDR